MTADLASTDGHDSLVAPYFAALRNDEFILQRCDECLAYVFMPRVACPACHQETLEWVPASGRGEVWAATEVHRAPSDSFRDRLPYWVILVRLDEGPMMMANYRLDPGEEAPVIGDKVSVRHGSIGQDGRPRLEFGRT